MQSIPIRAYVRTEHAYPKLPHIASVVFPDSKEYQKNTDATPGAKIVYLFYDYAKDACNEQVNSIAAIVENAPWLYNGMPEKCCMHCKHYDTYYRKSTIDGHLFAALEGKCHVAQRSIRGKTVKSKACCDRFEMK